MTPEWREWLPAGAFCAERIHAACSPALDAWRNRWFTGVSEVSLRKAAGDRPGRSQWQGVFRATGFQLLLDASSRSNLYEALAGRLPATTDVSASDVALLDAAVQAAVEDLGRTFAGSAGNEKSAQLADYKFDLAYGPATLLRISANANFLAYMLRKAIKPSRRVFEPTSLREALRNCPTRISADLGSTEIGMSELEALEIGDVIILDTHVGSTIDLRLERTGTRIARGVLADAEQRNAIRITG